MQPFGMRSILTVLLLSASVHGFIETFFKNSSEPILSHAVARIILDVRKHQLTTLHFTRSEATSDDIISLAVDLIRTNYSFTIEKIGHTTDWYLRWFNIVFINGEEDLWNFIKKLNQACFDHRGYYIVVVEPVLSTESQENLCRTILRTFFDLFYDNVIVLFKDEAESKVFMYTFMPCDLTHACYEVVPLLFNTFEGGKFGNKSWHFPKKWQNFNRCPVSVGVNHFPPHILLEHTENGETNVGGVDANILSMIAQHLNFSIDYKTSNERGWFYPNGTASGVFDWLLTGKASLIMAGYSQSPQRAEYFSGSIPYVHTSMVYALPVSLEIGPLERHLLPFKKEIWITFFSIQFGAFIFLSILKKFGSKLYNFVVGDHTRSPYLDMIQIFLGVSSHRTPRYTFARSLFGIWLLSNFIISTTYRGRLVEILTSRSPQRSPRTIRELIDMDYEICIRPQLAPHVMKFFENDLRFKLYEPTWDCFLELQKPSGRRKAVVESQIYVHYFNAQRYRDGILPILPERIQRINTVILFKKNSYFVNVFNRVLKKFAYNGLTNKWMQDTVNIDTLKRLQNSAHKTLSVSHFQGTFEICAMMLGLAVSMLVIELISLKWTPLRKMIEFYSK